MCSLSGEILTAVELVCGFTSEVGNTDEGFIFLRKLQRHRLCKPYTKTRSVELTELDGRSIAGCFACLLEPLTSVITVGFDICLGFLSERCLSA
jgi:hypothetical protein